MIKDENYYVVHGWMRNRLALRGNELLIYAVLYGFTQDGVSEFRGTLEYISEFVGSTTRTTRSILNSLCEKGLVDKIEYNSEREVPVTSCCKHCNERASISSKLLPKIDLERNNK